ncbi:MAG: nitroreductase family protein [Gammaproteobacteria bacterium]|nr:nitroreductase family protein [Gammaproteobacteria bacterium]
MKKTLLNTAKRPIQILTKRLTFLLTKVCSKNSFLAGVYYLIFSRKFDREHLAVLRGHLNYNASLKNISNTSPLLRRNIHRIEKGLIMKPRRAVFAENFILETVECHRRATERTGYCENELKWATDVLDEYFEAVQLANAATEVQVAHAYYCDTTKNVGQNSIKQKIEAYRPYARSESPPCRVDYSALVDLFQRRRSIRWYQDCPVPENLIHDCINAASLAPSACNRQPYRFVVANGVEKARSVAACAGGTLGFAQQLPAVLVVVGDLSAYPEERDRHLIYIDSSLAAMQLMLTAETLGLATCPINWPDVDRSERAIQKIINLAAHERVIMLIAIGFAAPDGGVPFSQKKGVGILSKKVDS